jgi:Ca2+-binding EF-hand superfamily protein
MRRASALTVLGLLLTPVAHAGHPTTISAYLRLMDTNGDGRISLAEYQAHMSQGFHAMDRNGDDIIERSEQPPGPRRHGPITLHQYMRNLAATFHRQDANHDGYLDARELLAPPR